MLIALWIVNALLALALFGSGLIKIVRTPQQLAAAGMHWTTATTTPVIKLIGAAEAVAAVGLIAPLATGIAPILTPLAAVGATLIMAGACVVHLRRRESPAAAAVLTALSLASAILGFVTLV